MDLNLLRSQLERPGYSQAELARRLGLAPSGVAKILNGKRKIIAHEAEIIRQYVSSPPGTPAEPPAAPTGPDAVLPHDDAGSEFRTTANAEMAAGAPPPPDRMSMLRDVPVYGTVLGGDAGHMADFQMNGEIVDYVRRPPRIATRKDVFAAYVQGMSMFPWRQPGQLIYLESARPPSNGDYVLIQLKPNNGDDIRGALVKQLLGVTPTKLKLQQYKPEKQFEIELKFVDKIFRVMDWNELMAV